MKQSIKDIETLLSRKQIPLTLIKQLHKDKRKGVQKLLNKWINKQNQIKMQKQKFFEMCCYEKDLQAKNISLIAGIDEVGRGPLAGPIVASTVILPSNFYLPGLDDSKKLTEKKREEYYNYINENSLSIGIGIVQNKTIDDINIYQATKQAMLKSIFNLKVTPEYLLIDAMNLEINIPQTSIIKGDTKSISIASASIIAKVTRDKIMKNLGEKYPRYGFEKHMGYGTKDHLQAIKNFGITPYHRLSFGPIKDMINK